MTATIANILQDAMRRRRPEGVLDAAEDFLLDRLDDTLEIVARSLTGKASWEAIELFKQAYLPAVREGGIGRFALFALDDKTEQDDHVARIYNKSLLYSSTSR